jgi:hypothetical protein
LVVVVAAGCTGGSGGPDDARQRDGAGSTAHRPAQDPPTSFAERAIERASQYHPFVG